MILKEYKASLPTNILHSVEAPEYSLCLLTQG